MSETYTSESVFLCICIKDSSLIPIIQGWLRVSRRRRSDLVAFDAIVRSEARRVTEAAAFGVKRAVSVINRAAAASRSIAMSRGARTLRHWRALTIIRG